jgi:DNA invertase Pin-like site-specific DNA recombinase
VSDENSRSVDQQNAAGVLAAQRYGWFVAGTYSEPDRSASRFARKGRPEWERLLTDIRARRLDIVILWEPSRGDRNLATWAAFLDACRNTGTKIYITDHDKVYDPAQARDWRSLAEDGIDSAYESEKTSTRVRRGVAGAAEQGKPYGRLPYGYNRTYEYVRGASKPLVHQEPNPEEAPVVREIITRLSRSEAITAIIRDLDQRGIRTRAGGKWSNASIARLAKEGVVYIGKRRHNGGPLLDGNWDPIVDVDVYWRAVNVLADPNRKRQADKRGGIRPGAARWLLSYLAHCGVCSRPLSVKYLDRAAARRIPHYRCAEGCVVSTVEWLDELATVAVVGFCAQTPMYELLTREEDSEAQAARNEAAGERARLAGFEEQAISGKISASSFTRIASGIESRIAELEERATKLSTPPPLRDLMAGVSGATREERHAEILRRWDAMALTSQRAVVRAMFAPVLHPAGRNPSDPARFKCPPAPGLLAEAG